MKRFLAILTNQRPFTSSGEWQQLTPFGVFAHKLGRQKVTPESAGKVVAALNAAKTAAGSAWRGIPIFIGHPPERGGDPAQKGQKFPRIGAVMNAEVREDGLWGQIALNNLGTENATEGHYIYPSPGWYFDRLSEGVIAPNELDHIGMTNTPNIEGVLPWTNESDTDSETQSDQDTMNKAAIARLKAALKLPEDADDDAVCNAVDKLNQDIAANAVIVTEKTTLATNEAALRTTTETALATEKAAREKAVNDLATARTAHAKTLLDVAVNEGRITVAERPTHEAAFAADFTVAANSLAAIKTAKHDTKPLHLDVQGAKVSIATNEDRRTIIDRAVNERMEKDKCDYSTAFNRVRKDPTFKPVFDAMEKPKSADGK